MAHESVVVDTSFFPQLRRIDDDCGLLEFVIDCFGPLAIADRGQLEKMGSCPNARKLFTDHGISDEDVMVWIGGSGPETEQRFLQHAISDDLTT
uniref:Uncharacterized protein n=1 Tax=Candidatus Kentrum sp. FW TaxID=2126338 RepID=A0A450SFI9_9GAMM|nr:MAG: hypothetical protein BECKFW1821A_GA0114235_103210 [Candidatus Kentron sp. FW]